MPGRAGGEPVPLQQEDVGPPQPGQVVGHAGADHAAADHHHLGPGRQVRGGCGGRVDGARIGGSVRHALNHRSRSRALSPVRSSCPNPSSPRLPGPTPFSGESLKPWEGRVQVRTVAMVPAPWHASDQPRASPASVAGGVLRAADRRLRRLRGLDHPRRPPRARLQPAAGRLPQQPRLHAQRRPVPDPGPRRPHVPAGLVRARRRPGPVRLRQHLLDDLHPAAGPAAVPDLRGRPVAVVLPDRVRRAADDRARDGGRTGAAEPVAGRHRRRPGGRGRHGSHRRPGPRGDRRQLGGGADHAGLPAARTSCSC